MERSCQKSHADGDYDEEEDQQIMILIRIIKYSGMDRFAVIQRQVYFAAETGMTHCLGRYAVLQMCMSYSTYRYTPVQGQVCFTAGTGMLRCRDSMLSSKHTLYCTQVCCAADVHVILQIQVHSSAGTGMFYCRDRYVPL